MWVVQHGEPCRVLFKVGVTRASLALSSVVEFGWTMARPSFPCYQPLHSRQRTELREDSTVVCLKPESLMLGTLSPHGV